MGEEVVARLVLGLTMVGSGGLLVWMAGAAAGGRLGRNSIAGIRLASTMSSDEAWLVAHQRAKRPTQWAGWFAIAGSLPAVLPVAMPVVAGSVIIGAVAMLAFVLYAAAVGSRAARALGDPPPGSHRM